MPEPTDEELREALLHAIINNAHDSEAVERLAELADDPDRIRQLLADPD